MQNLGSVKSTRCFRHCQSPRPSWLHRRSHRKTELHHPHKQCLKTSLSNLGYPKGEFKAEAKLIANTLIKGEILMSKSTFDVNLKGREGDYFLSDLDKIVKSYKPGGHAATKIKDDALTQRILTYYKEVYNYPDVYYISLRGQTLKNHGTMNSVNVVVTYKNKKGNCGF